ncbi:hypothetical protein ACIP6V_23980 [Streptomyces sp. NPDC088770]|uniref:hypothetical protein n=1 Tax=unclassified Streptomyces TaxID=2593676 RepID=UPI002DD94573|nr:hypothetical protein [Streptomyces sp. NBC_01788]WSB29738.1 hypothetical protein OIE49_29750 [Streptomyces sp. NBC_01788]
MTSPEELPPDENFSPSPPYTSERRDSCTAEQWDVPSRTYRRYDCGVLAEERPFTDAENASADQQIADTARRATQTVLLEQARVDLAVNEAYLAAVASGAAGLEDAVAQVAELTRQAQGVIRLTVGADLLDRPAPSPLDDG